MKEQRKHYSPEEKVAILRRHLLEKEPISNLCDELGLQPTVFYRWQKEFFENGAAAFEDGATEPLSRPGADRLPGEEDPDQGRGSGRTDGGARGRKKKRLGNSERNLGIHGTRSWISSGVGQGRPRSAPGGSSSGSTSPPASSTTGENATARLTSTTAGFPAISGWRSGRSRPSSGST